MTKIEWDSDKVAKLRKIMASGASMQEAADNFSTSHGSISSACRRHGIKSTRPQGGWHGSNQYVKAQKPLPNYGVNQDPFGMPT